MQEMQGDARQWVWGRVPDLQGVLLRCDDHYLTPVSSRRLTNAPLARLNTGVTRTSSAGAPE